MLIEQTLEKLNGMKLGAMAEAFQQQLRSDDAATLSVEDRVGLLVDAEWTAREQRTLQRRLRTAKLRYPASLEAVDFTHPRRLNRQQVLTLGSCAWIAEAPQSAHHRAHRHRQELPRLCLRRAGVSPRLYGALRPHAPGAARGGRRPR